MSVRFAIPSTRPTVTNLERHVTAPNRPSGPGSVLFVGNSLPARNDLPGRIATLAAAPGKEFRHRRIRAGGASLRTRRTAGEAGNSIRSGKDDAVVLQGRSTPPVQNATRMHETAAPSTAPSWPRAGGRTST